MAENQKIYISVFDAQEYDISELPIRWQRELKKLSYFALFCTLRDFEGVSETVHVVNTMTEEDLGV